MDTIAEEQDSNSPSKVTESLGKDAVEGYNLGISNNTQSTLNTVTSYMQSIKQAFSDLGRIFVEIGNQIMRGLLIGMSSVEISLYEKANSIADNIANTIKTAFDIHSPSRVMFELGNFTMLGFKEGIENLYLPTLSSIKKFDKDLKIASCPTVGNLWRDYQYAYENAYTPINKFSINRDNSYRQDTSETNTLLRELLSEFKKGHTINMDGRIVAECFRDRANEFHRRTGKPYVDI